MALRGTSVCQAVSSAQAAQVKMRGAADAAGARRHDQPGLRILAAQDDFEAAEQLGLGPGVDDAAVLDLDAHVEVAFDPADRRNVEGLRPTRPSPRAQTTKMSSSAQRGDAALAAVDSLI